jgi:hypothetical protein
LPPHKGNVKVAHAVAVFLRWLNHFRSACGEIDVKTTVILDENASATVRRRLRISGPPVVAVMSGRIGSFDNPKGSRAPCAIAKNFA